ncbi:hypothetical protein ACYOEI_26560 [Singulisphaera rosea]
MSEVRGPGGVEDSAHAEAVRELEAAIRSRIQVTGRDHQTWTEILDILVGLGYKKGPDEQGETEAYGGIQRRTLTDRAGDLPPKGSSQDPSDPR